MSNRRLFAILASVVVITAVAILVLVLIPKATVVEFKITATETSFHVRAPRGPDTSTSLLSGEVRAQSMEVSGFSRIDVAQPNGRIFSSDFAAAADSKAQLRKRDRFSPDVRLGSAARIAVVPLGRDRVVVRIDPTGEGGFGWQCRAGARGNVDVRITGDPGADEKFREAFPEGKWTEAAGIPAVLFAGENGEAGLGLHLAAGGNEPATTIRVVDLSSGEIVSNHEVPLALNQREVVTVDGDRVVVLSASAPRETGVLLLEPNLAVTAPRFFTLIGTQADVHLRGGQIRFPAGERAAIELGSDFLLEVEHRDPLTLKSLRVVEGRLEMVLWGTSSSVRLGPTSGLMEEKLPNCFVWLYNHRMGTLAFSLLGWLVGATIAALKLFGWVKT